jgi:NAD(P)-dependent dehydrogenase (short-subunit alcohol dehydrogenase family)
MNYLVTGSTGFIGKHFVAQLLRRGGTVYALVRAASRERLEALAAERYAGLPGKLVPLVGDIAEPGCGLDAAQRAELKGRIDHLVHLAAIYDMDVDLETAKKANVEGTRHAVQLANELGARLQYVSSIVVAGEYRGTFREDMFAEGQHHAHPYFITKYEAEALVRREARTPFRVYRPGVVIGSSETGEADKIDGPYYAFKLIQRARSLFPQWFPLVGIEGARLHLVPVDYVAKAMDHIMHKDGLDGRAFHLTDPKPLSLGDAMNTFCRAAHAPEFTARIDNKVFEFVPKGVVDMVGHLPTVQNAKRELMAGLHIPPAVLDYADWRTKFDTRDTEQALAGSGISCPPLPTYAWKIWDYWERHMDPDLFRDRSLAGALKGKKVLITGASSGIGHAVALKVGEVGGIPLLVARSIDKLAETKAAIEAGGGTAFVYPCDLSEIESCDELVKTVVAEHGGIDVLVNNAGRSIRRTVGNSYDRFHDFERTIKLNYFGSLKLILGFLPGMRARKSGHIINVSSIGVQTNAPRFSAYVASKSALDSFSRSMASEIVNDRVHVTTVYMPLVRTPMIAPTKIYDAFPAITPEDAADMILSGVLTKQKRVATRLGIFTEIAYAVAPKAVDYVLNIGFRLFPDNPTQGKKQEEVSVEGVAFAHLLKGIHW